MEWGCMQALIDFDGWRKWKDFSSLQAKDSAAKTAGAAAKSANAKVAASGPGGANKRERGERRGGGVAVGEGGEGKVVAAVGA